MTQSRNSPAQNPEKELHGLLLGVPGKKSFSHYASAAVNAHTPGASRQALLDLAEIAHHIGDLAVGLAESDAPQSKRVPAQNPEKELHGLLLGVPGKKSFADYAMAAVNPGTPEASRQALLDLAEIANHIGDVAGGLAEPEPLGTPFGENPRHERSVRRSSGVEVNIEMPMKAVNWETAFVEATNMPSAPSSAVQDFQRTALNAISKGPLSEGFLNPPKGIGKTGFGRVEGVAELDEEVPDPGLLSRKSDSQRLKEAVEAWDGLPGLELLEQKRDFLNALRAAAGPHTSENDSRPTPSIGKTGQSPAEGIAPQTPSAEADGAAGAGLA